jgi:hypothetical protein
MDEDQAGVEEPAEFLVEPAPRAGASGSRPRRLVRRGRVGGGSVHRTHWHGDYSLARPRTGRDAGPDSWAWLGTRSTAADRDAEPAPSRPTRRGVYHFDVRRGRFTVTGVARLSKPMGELCPASTCPRRTGRPSSATRSTAPEVRFRAHILLLLDAGYPWETTAAVLFCSVSTISRWKRRFDGEGVDAAHGAGVGPASTSGPHWLCGGC